MPAEFIAGDLFALKDVQALAHGVNCAGAMGAGIAVEFRRRWPDMYAKYHEDCKANKLRPGDVMSWTSSKPIIYNLATQKSWRTPATLEAIRTSLETMVTLTKLDEVQAVGLPKIGAGLGGLPWVKVRALIEEIGGLSEVRLIVVEDWKPTS